MRLPRRISVFHVLLALTIFAIAREASAQGFTQDVWNEYSKSRGLFTPHVNDCTSTEVFVQMGPGTLGICMEKSLRGSLTYLNARKACSDDGMRLPEPYEYQYACYNPPAGLNNILGTYQFITNSVSVAYLAANNSWYTVIGGISNSDCTAISVDYTYGTQGSGSVPSRAFRCVR